MVDDDFLERCEDDEVFERANKTKCREVWLKQRRNETSFDKAIKENGNPFLQQQLFDDEDINIVDADPITKITKNPMFPLIAIGGLALAGLIYFKIIKI